MGMWGFLDRAIALIDVGACQKVTEDLGSLEGRKIFWVCSHPQNAGRTSRRALAYIEIIRRFIQPWRAFKSDALNQSFSVSPTQMLFFVVIQIPPMIAP
jgi:hypothetical protein